MQPEFKLTLPRSKSILDLLHDATSRVVPSQIHLCLGVVGRKIGHGLDSLFSSYSQMSSAGVPSKSCTLSLRDSNLINDTLGLQAAFVEFDKWTA
jgi:hypothetical protein